MNTALLRTERLPPLMSGTSSSASQCTTIEAEAVAAGSAATDTTTCSVTTSPGVKVRAGMNIVDESRLPLSVTLLGSKTAHEYCRSPLDAHAGFSALATTTRSRERRTFTVCGPAMKTDGLSVCERSTVCNTLLVIPVMRLVTVKLNE